MNSSFMHYFNEKKFLFTFERERGRESTKGWNSWILGYHFEVESAIIFFYGYNCLENKDRHFLYKMYIKGFFLDRKQNVHLKNTKCYMFMCFYFSLNFKITFISKKKKYFNDFLRRSIESLTNNLVFVRAYF